MMSSREKRALKIKQNSYVLISGIMFRRNYDGVMLRCLLVQETHEILEEMYEGMCGVNFSPKATSCHIIRSRYY